MIQYEHTKIIHHGFVEDELRRCRDLATQFQKPYELWLIILIDLNTIYVSEYGFINPDNIITSN